MEPHISAADRARGAELAREPAERAGAGADGRGDAAAHRLTAPPDARRRRQPPRDRRADAARARPPSVRPRPRPAPPRVAAAGGRWRIQLGAFSSEANARRAWGAVAGRLPGLQPYYVRAGDVDPASRPGRCATAPPPQRACASAGSGCFPVAP